MKKIFSLLFIALVLFTSVLSFTSCGGDDDCFICGGSGYYQKKDCPGC